MGTQPETARGEAPAGIVAAASKLRTSPPAQAQPALASCHLLQTAQQKIQDILKKRIAELPEELTKVPLHHHCVKLPNPGAQLRTLIFNLKDPRNPDFIKDVLSLEILPEDLPSLSTEEMASAASRAARSARHEQLAQASTLQRGVSGAIDRAALAQ